MYPLRMRTELIGDLLIAVLDEMKDGFSQCKDMLLGPQILVQTCRSTSCVVLRCNFARKQISTMSGLKRFWYRDPFPPF